MSALVFGHRGTRRGAPENTLSAFRLALSQGADGIELDVRPCRSGELVAVHDPDLARVAGDARPVAELAWSELARVPLAGGERVPLLREALELVLGADKRLNVELKSDVPDREAALAAAIAELSPLSESERERVVLSSFDRRLGAALRAALPGFAVARLVAREVASLAGFDGVHPRHDLVTAERVRAWHGAGLFVNAWTVNDAACATRLRAAGVDGLITDDVPLLRAALA